MLLPTPGGREAPPERRLAPRAAATHNTSQMVERSDSAALLEKVLDPRGGVFVLTGPARSGKTVTVLEVYRRHLDEMGRPRCLLIVPNAPTAGWLRRRLLEQSPGGVLIAPAVTTFAALAGSILAAAGRPAQTLSGVQRRLMLEGIVRELHRAGRLRALGPIADTPGLVRALDQAISELKRAAVEPDALAAAVAGRSDKDADLLAVYRRYQELLLRTGRFDPEGQMWLARDLLAERPDAPLGYDEPTCLAVDGFTDFTPTELSILASLSRRLGRTIITLPLGDDPGRERLWFWTRRTLGRLEEAVGAIRRVRADPAVETWPGLFDLSADRARGGCGMGEGFSLNVLEAADLEAEVRAVARAVKADLLAGAAGGSVAVVVRDLEGYVEPIERVFRSHGIPVAARPRRLVEAGVVRFVLRLLSLPPRYEFHDVLSVIKSSYFRPGALGADFDAAVVATAEMAARRANVLGGRESYGRAFARLARRARMQEEDDSDDEPMELGPLRADPEAIERAGAMLEALFERLERLGGAGDAGAYAEAVRRLVRELEVEAAAAESDDEDLAAADLRALRAFEQVLDDLAAVEPPVGAGAEELSAALARAAASASSPAARGEAVVIVLDALDARAIRFEKVYLLGVNERAFPRLGQERCFIDESDRSAWARRGVRLDRRRDLLAREMLLFYLAVTRAERSLTVSHLSADAKGTPHGPSVFLEDLLAAAGDGGIEVRRRRIGPGQFVPAAEEIACASDALNAAVEAAFHDEGEARGLLGWVRRNCPERLLRAAFGTLAGERRWRRGGVDAYDGRIDEPRLRRELERRMGGEWTFTASALNAYARCRWQFFAQYLLGLEPLVEPERRLTPAAVGTFCHAVLWRVMTALRDRCGGPVALSEVGEEELLEELRRAVAAERERLDPAAVHALLWDVQVRFWEGLLAGYLLRQHQDPGEVGPARSEYFELGFGVDPRRHGSRLDPASRDEPVELTVGAQKMRLAGKIDRVDVLGPEGPGPLLVVDYKTGRLPTAGDIATGRDLQLALYARAVEVLLDRRCAGGAYHDVRRGDRRYLAAFKVPRARGEESVDYEQMLSDLMDAVGRYVRDMRRGRFDALPASPCPSWCPYRQICHYSEHRAERKSAGEGDDE